MIPRGHRNFLSRFLLNDVLTARRFDGLTQRQISVSQPDFFPNIPLFDAATGFPGNVQQLSPTLQAPYFLQSAVSLERQLAANTTVALTYANTYGSHLFRSRDVNTPLNDVYPLGRPGMLVPDGVIRHLPVMLVNVNSKVAREISSTAPSGLWRGEQHQRSGNIPRRIRIAWPASTVPPPPTSVTARSSFAGTIGTKYGIHLNPLLTVNSGLPFNIITGGNLYGDTIFNVRPGYRLCAPVPGSSAPVPAFSI